MIYSTVSISANMLDLLGEEALFQNPTCSSKRGCKISPRKEPAAVPRSANTGASARPSLARPSLARPAPA